MRIWLNAQDCQDFIIISQIPTEIRRICKFIIMLRDNAKKYLIPIIPIVCFLCFCFNWMTLCCFLCKFNFWSILFYFAIKPLTDPGSTYVRWGRRQCAGVNTDLVYTGNLYESVYHLHFSYLSKGAFLWLVDVHRFDHIMCVAIISFILLQFEAQCNAVLIKDVIVINNKSHFLQLFVDI